MSQNKPKVKYDKDNDILELIFKKNKVPEVVKLSTGVMLEFNKKTLTAIILPHFLQVIKHPPAPNIEIEFEKMELDEEESKLTLILKNYNRTIRLKIDLFELEKYK